MRAALACALEWLLPGGKAVAIAAAAFLLFPFLLLCELESGSAFTPASGLVLASLWRQSAAWLLFYAESGGLFAVAGVLVILVGPRINLSIGVVMGGMLFAAVAMIYFRLLGRLAWHCSIEPEDESEGDEESPEDDD